MRCSVVFGVTLRLLVINISSSSPAKKNERKNGEKISGYWVTLAIWGEVTPDATLTKFGL